MCDTDSMAIVGFRARRLVPCKGGPSRMSRNRSDQALSWREVKRIVGAFQALNPYDPTSCPLDSEYRRRRLITTSAATATDPRLRHFREAICPIYAGRVTWQIIKASEHGWVSITDHKEGRDLSCDVPVWINQGWAMDCEPLVLVDRLVLTDLEALVSDN